jgi:hypothetical protein
MEGAVGRATEENVFPAVGVRARLRFTRGFVLSEKELLHGGDVRSYGSSEVIPSNKPILVCI